MGIIRVSRKIERFISEMKIALVGGGEGMLLAMSVLRERGSHVHAYCSFRHGQELVRGEQLASQFFSQGLPLSQINSEVEFAKVIDKENYDLIFGMGPEWIFSGTTLSLAKRWVNINIIPYPKYLGGAHVSWQILNGDLRGSVVFQEMIREVDKGKILDKFDFLYSSANDGPEHRFSRNQEELLRALPKFMSSFQLNAPMKDQHFVDEAREYWPRLKTDTHGWIDWSWSSLHILSFINAFSAPYPGARTRLGGYVITVLSGKVIEMRDFHPFSVGIILRKPDENSLVVATRDGILELECRLPEKIRCSFLEGSRVFTPSEDLELAMQSHLHTKDFRVAE